MPAGMLDGVIDPQAQSLNGAVVSLLSWARILVRWRMLLAASATGFVALGCVAALMLPNRFTASVVLLPQQQSSSKRGRDHGPVNQSWGLSGGRGGGRRT